MGPFVRIFLRYAAGVLIARGMIDPATGHSLAVDPDVVQIAMTVVGALMAVGTEVWYRAARKLDWAK